MFLESRFAHVYLSVIKFCSMSFERPAALSVSIQFSSRAACNQADVSAERAHEFRYEHGKHEGLEGCMAFRASAPGRGRETPWVQEKRTMQQKEEEKKQPSQQQAPEAVKQKAYNIPKGTVALQVPAKQASEKRQRSKSREPVASRAASQHASEQVQEGGSSSSGTAWGASQGWSQSPSQQGWSQSAWQGWSQSDRNKGWSQR